MKRSVRSLAVALALLLSLCSSGFAAGKAPVQHFSDVPSTHWAYDCIEELVSCGAISGYPDGKFYPEKTVTREEFAKIMVMAAGLVPLPAGESSYADVALSHWSSPYIETARPYMTAYRSMGQLWFYPFSGALREDMAVAVVKLRGFDPAKADLSLLSTMFSDLASISEVARPYVALAVEHDIIRGYNDGTFRGQGTITRAEAAAILYRAFQTVSGDKVIPDDLLPTPSPEPSSEVTPSPAPSQEPTPPPSPEPTQPPELPAPVARYGYITSHSYSVYSPEHKAILTTFDLWNGEETVTVLTTSSGSYTAGTAISYLDLGDGHVDQITPIPDVGAVIAFDGQNTLLLQKADGSQSGEFSLDKTTIIFFDSSRRSGIASASLRLAEQNGDGAYIPNVFYQLSGNGQELKALFVDVNNQIPGAPAIPRT